jgi:hypothetical protein
MFGAIKIASLRVPTKKAPNTNKTEGMNEKKEEI